jgi:hypothetical protein
MLARSRTPPTLRALNGPLLGYSIQILGVGAENLIRPCEQGEWIEAMEWVNSILAMSGDVVAAQTHDPTLGRTR